MTEQTLKLEARNVYKSFGTIEILKDVGVRVHDGEVVALIGPSGAGKSTFLRCVNSLHTVDSGTIEINGDLIGYQKVGDHLEALPDKVASAQRARIGMVFQSFNLFRHLTALDNVAYGPRYIQKKSRKEARATALELLEKIGLKGREHHYPAELSGGQQQRVAIARALAMEPTMLLMDEPTSALDPELRVEVASVIRALAEQDRTMLIATHDLPLVADIADRVVFMVNGEIVEEGPVSRVLHDPVEPRTRAFVQKMSGARSDDPV